jgi:hypothetical protein
MQYAYHSALALDDFCVHIARSYLQKGDVIFLIDKVLPVCSGFLILIMHNVDNFT